MNSINTAELRFYYVVQYYDRNADPLNPIKDAQIYDIIGTTSIGHYNMIYQHVKENKVIYLNGTTQTFFSLGKREFFFSPLAARNIRIQMQMDSEYSIYEQFSLSQPVSTTVRNLQTDTTIGTNSSLGKLEENYYKKYWYNILYILSQVGGMLIVLLLITGILIEPYQRKVNDFWIVNRFWALVSTETYSFNYYYRKIAFNPIKEKPKKPVVNSKNSKSMGYKSKYNTYNYLELNEFNKSSFEFIPLVDPVIHDEEDHDNKLNIDQSNEYIKNDFKNEEFDFSQESLKHYESQEVVQEVVQEETEADLYQAEKYVVSR